MYLCDGNHIGLLAICCGRTDREGLMRSHCAAAFTLTLGFAAPRDNGLHLLRERALKDDDLSACTRRRDAQRTAQ